jgi:hypothetical protein
MGNRKQRLIAGVVRRLHTTVGLAVIFALISGSTAAASTGETATESCVIRNPSLAGIPVACASLLGQVLLLVGHWSAENKNNESKSDIRFQFDGAPRPMQGPPMLVRPGRQPCPSGTTNYIGPAQPYSCLAVYSDNAGRGHPVPLRQGHADPAGFGLLHALQDHNVDEQTIATIIVNNAAGVAQGNNRFIYGLRFEVAGLGLVAVEVLEDRNPSTAAPDGQELGVLTAYCKGMTRCPDEVNTSIEQSTR